MSEHFSDRMREAVVLAGREARDLGHVAVSDGHLLLGLLHARRGLAARVLKRHRVELRTTREMLQPTGLRRQGGETELLPLELPAKRALQLALHEAFERNDGPIRAGYLLIGILTVEGAAANLVRAQGVSPHQLADAARRKLPGADRVRGVELLEDRLATLVAYAAAIEWHAEVTRIITTASDRLAAAEAIAALLNLSQEQAIAVGDMPLDMATSEGVEALEVERRDLEQRLRAAGPKRPQSS